MRILDDVIKPTARQREFLRTVREKPKTLYGGAAGGGKSYILRWGLMYQLLRWAAQGHKNVRSGLFCEDYPSLNDRHLARVQIEFPEWLGTYRKTDRDFVLRPEYGSGVISFRNLDNPSKYLSSEFASVAIDELTMNSNREVFDFLTMRLRWPGIDDVRFMAATNPGGPGHGWVRNLWLDNPQEDFGFVQALASDNPHLAKGYYDALQKLPEAMRKAYADGNWDVFAGQVFTEFNRERHVAKEPFNIPHHWPKWASMDWGYAKPYSVHWHALDNEGRMITYRELYGYGGSPDVGTYEVASAVAAKVAAFNDPVPIYADPAMWSKGSTDNKSVADEFRAKGLSVIQANNGRIDGKNQIHTRLQQNSWLIFPACTHIIRTLPTLVYSKIRVEDVDTTQEDHAYDDIRYGAMVHRVPTGLPKHTKPDYSYVDKPEPVSWMAR